MKAVIEYDTEQDKAKASQLFSELIKSEGHIVYIAPSDFYKFEHGEKLAKKKK